MPIERHQTLVTVEAVRQWRSKGTEFFCRYDLVEFNANGAPVYNCVYLVGGEEKILVPEKARSDGTIQERKLTFFPGLFNLHRKFGDGTQLLVQDDYTLVTVRTIGGAIEVVSQGLDRTGLEGTE